MVKGVIGITKAAHIRSKGTEPIPDAVRLRLIEIACRPHSSWLVHCNGFGVKKNSHLQLAGLLKKSWPSDALVATVEGSDVFARYPPKKKNYAHDALKVIVARADEEEKIRKLLRELHSGADKILILSPDITLAAASSTKVRAATERGDRHKLVAMCGEAVADELLL